MNFPTDRDRRTTDAEELSRAIRDLPQAVPGPGFRSAVLSRAAGAVTRRRLMRRRLVALSAAVCVAAASVGAWRLEIVRERAERRAALVEEHRRLADELDELRALAGRRSSIRLGGDATTDLYIDLAPVAVGGPAATARERPYNPSRSHS